MTMLISLHYFAYTHKLYFPYGIDVVSEDCGSRGEAVNTVHKYILFPLSGCLQEGGYFTHDLTRLYTTRPTLTQVDTQSD